MLARFRQRLTYANVMATLAVFMVLGGGAYAATQLPRNSVGSKQLRNNAVSSSKVKDRSLLARDFARGQLPAGRAGASGPKGDRGTDGKNGKNGTDGLKGADGKTVRNGSGAPDSSAGNDGDFYIDTSANAIYGPKNGGSWGSPTSLVGPSGATSKSIHTSTTIVGAGADGLTTATCPTGSKATGGGFSVAGPSLQITSSYPTGTEAWEIDAHNNSSATAVQLLAYVVCVSP